MNQLIQKIRETISEKEMPSYIYTYPTKKSYVPMTDWKKACESWSKVAGPITLYIHIPFCEMKCSFCDLFTATNQPEKVIDRYVKAIIKEIEIMEKYLKKDKISIQSIYFGGGTPTLLSKEQLDAIIHKIRNTFVIANHAEWSIEGAPNSFTIEKLGCFKSSGINRLSIGIQSFDAQELIAMGRFYDPILSQTMAKAAVESGIGNINLDLIYGIPGQTFKGWKQNLLTAIDIAPATITTYPLAVRSRTAFGKQMERGLRNDLADASERYRWYDFTKEQLLYAGYKQQTLVTYSKEGGGCLHEANEFSGIPTLSLGAGSRKYAPDFHYVDEDYINRKPNRVTMMEYMDAIERNELLVKSGVQLTKNDQILRYLILGLLANGIDTLKYLEKFQESIEDRFLDLLQAFNDEGFTADVNSLITLTVKGRRFSSHVGNFIAENYGVG